MTSGFQFTSSQDWFSGHVEVWQKLISDLLKGVCHSPKALEIGSWEGRSAVYLLQNLCMDDRSELVCIDHFDLQQNNDSRARYNRFLHNINVTGRSVRLIDDFSIPALYALLTENIRDATGGFDFVYVDGSHEADDTFLDAELAWRLCHEGALIIFDDYEWLTEPYDSIHHPRRGIDTFLQLHVGEFELLHQGYQIAIKKSTPQRIGFLSKQILKINDPPAIQYGMNIVLCTDEDYALPTAVAILSTINSTSQNRITFYVGDCGLSDSSRNNLHSLVSKTAHARVTLVIIPMPQGSISRMDPSWAKIEIIKQLPIERAIHLDSDVLVRHDLTELWSMDLKDNVLGASLDIGYPGGPDDEYSEGYFNAGVLLLDYTRIREESPGICNLDLHEHTSGRYKDQDLLNSFFSRRWSKFGIEWNATGLGSYALQYSIQRAMTWPKACIDRIHDDPKIVHFTGPVHPTMAAVLDPYNQPFVAKPWGYAGSPGHPFEHEWIVCASQTPWASFFNSSERAKYLLEQKSKAMEKGTYAFTERLRPSCVSS